MNPTVRRNFILGVAHECLWGFAFGMTNPFTVAQQGLVDLGGDARMAGLLGALIFACLNGPQLLTAFLLPPRFSERWRLAVLHVPAIACTAAAAAVGGGLFGLGPEAARAAWLAAVAGHFLFLGLVVPYWIACLGRLVPADIRGRFFGASFGLAALLGVGGGWLAQRWINGGGLEWGYAACFGAAVPLQVLSAALFGFTRPLGEAPLPAGRLGAYLREQWGHLTGSRTFQVFGLFAVLMQVATASSSLFTPWLNTRGDAQALVAWTTSAIQLGTVAGALLLGAMLDSSGPRRALGLAFAVFLAGLGWIAAPLSLKAATAAFFGPGFFNSAFPVVTTYLVLSLAPRGRQLIYTGLFNSLMAPWAFFAPLALGWLAERHSYGAAFSVSAAACRLVRAKRGLRNRSSAGPVSPTIRRGGSPLRVWSGSGST